MFPTNPVKLFSSLGAFIAERSLVLSMGNEPQSVPGLSQEGIGSFNVLIDGMAILW